MKSVMLDGFKFDSKISSSPTRQYWRLFSPQVVSLLLREGGGYHVLKLIRELGYPMPSARTHTSLGAIYEDIYVRLTAQGPAEYAYKNAIVQRTLYSRHSSPDNRVQFEFRTGSSKLDALVLNNALHAIEIKSEFDHLRRLANQLAAYKSRFAYVWVFASERNLAAVERAVDADVGLVCLRANQRFSIERNADPDFSRLESKSMLEMLRRYEYLLIAQRLGFYSEGIPNTRVFGEVMSFANTIEPTLLQVELREVLAARMLQIPKRKLRSVPYSLRGVVVPLLLGGHDLGFLAANLDNRV